MKKTTCSVFRLPCSSKKASRASGSVTFGPFGPNVARTLSRISETRWSPTFELEDIGVWRLLVTIQDGLAAAGRLGA
jgi:hypothetical protein